MPNRKIWFTAKDERYVEPAEKYFFSSTEIPELEIIEKNADLIIQEYKTVCTHQQIYTPYFQKDFAYPPESWETLPLYVFGAKRANANHFPVLTKLLESTPHMVGCFFSKIKAESEIAPHSGVTDAIYRCHLAIILPTSQARITGIKVANKTSTWPLKKFIGFIDANFHSAWNHSSSERVVLIVDILRPEFRNQKYFLYSRVITTYGLVKLATVIPFNLIDRFFSWQKSKTILDIAGTTLIPVALFYIWLSRYRNRTSLSSRHIS